MRASDPVFTIDQQSFSGHAPRKMRSRRRFRGNHLQHSNGHLTISEVERLIKAASYIGRYGYRDSTMILLAYGHGFRVSELINLKWSHIDFDEGTVVVSRLKNGLETVHPLSQREKDSLRYLERHGPESEFVFVSGRKGPLTVSIVHRMVKRAGEEAGLRYPLQPSMLQKARGFDLASASSSYSSTQH